MIVATILAGGHGSRMESDLPKQFMMLKDKPILVHTTSKFLAHKDFNYIVVAVTTGFIDHTKEIFDKYFTKEENDRILICEGGDSRTSSLINSINEVKKVTGREKSFPIVTHDSARPFVSLDTIIEHTKLSWDNKVVGTAIKATDTIFVSNDGKSVDAIPDRKIMHMAQTPQTFFSEDYLKLIKESTENQIKSLSDACGLFMLHGYEIALAKGTRDNIKITCKEDIVIAEGILNKK